uniref:Glycosyltransferase family 4 protein n=2 Tax=unclassified Prevotella TaxID=2638335 RepID=A0AB33ISS7_9BACT
MKNERKKLIRITTADISLDSLLKGQLRFLNQYFDVVGVAKDTGVLQKVGEREGIRVIDAPLERPITPVKDIKALWFLFRLFRQEKPWCVHANTPKGSLLAMIAAWMARVPHRIYLVTGLRYQGTTGVFRFILKTMERMTCLFASKVIPEGNGVLCSLQSDHITSKPLEVIHYGNINGVDTTYFSVDEVQKSCGNVAREVFRSRLGFIKSDFVFVFVGRIVHDKGIFELIEALKRLSSKLLLVGSFEAGDPVSIENKQYLELSDKVKMVGWQDDIRPYLWAADALVFPSYREGFPNVPMQAGAMNLASIVTNISGCNEIIKDGLNGKLVQSRNVEALFMAMKWFMEHQADVARMAENARGMIEERYEQLDVWNALLDCYNAL